MPALFYKKKYWSWAHTERKGSALDIWSGKSACEPKARELFTYSLILFHLPTARRGPGEAFSTALSSRRSRKKLNRAACRQMKFDAEIKKKRRRYGGKVTALWSRFLPPPAMMMLRPNYNLRCCVKWPKRRRTDQNRSEENLKYSVSLL